MKTTQQKIKHEDDLKKNEDDLKKIKNKGDPPQKKLKK